MQILYFDVEEAHLLAMSSKTFKLNGELKKCKEQFFINSFSVMWTMVAKEKSKKKGYDVAVS